MLWNYLKHNFSVKKTDYVVCRQIEKYKKVIESIQSSVSDPPPSPDLKKDLESDLYDFYKKNIII